MPVPVTTEGRASERGYRDLVIAHPLGTYFGLAIALSWSYWIPDAIAGGHWSHFPGLLGPALAVAAIVLAVRWMAGTSPGPGISDMPGVPDLGWFGVAAFVLVIGGFGEESGWRAFAWPALRGGRSLASAAVLLAVPWAVWHVPLFWIDSGMRGFSIVMLPGFFMSLVCGAVVLGYVYDRSGALAAVALWHTMLNMATSTHATEVAAPFVSMVLILWAIWIVRTDRLMRAEEKPSPRSRLTARSRTSTLPKRGPVIAGRLPLPGRRRLPPIMRA